MGACPGESASRTCEMHRPNGRCNMRGSGWRPRHFSQKPSWRKEQDFFGQRLAPKFGISRLPETGPAKTTRRIGRANAGFSRKVSGIRDWGNCVVVDAIRYEPVSMPNSLLTGKLTGNYVEFACLMRF